ncbi:MAG: sacsin N-terminal ATP-binding-like domain-containing protein, partial [Propionibacteriaceae bacterium]
MEGWIGPDGPLGAFIGEQTEACLKVYAEDARRVEEDANIELSTAEGGYARKQLFELVQNAADALSHSSGVVHVILTDKTLYVANEGAPFSQEGAASLLASHLKRKNDDQIGQFGLGFKSVSAISDEPAVLSRTGSFIFNKAHARSLIESRGISSLRYPTLRLATPVDPDSLALQDAVLRGLMEWASTVIRIPLRTGRPILAADIADFPAAFLLFSPVVRELRLEDRGAGTSRVVRLSREGDQYVLADNEAVTRWAVNKVSYRPSQAAMRDAGELARRQAVDVAWAAPLGGARGLGEFWAFFPTGIRTTLSGVVNASWKLSADRRGMIPGDYNRELLTEVLPGLVARGLPGLSVPGDPAALLDALPARGREARSWADEIINDPIFKALARTPSLPDLDGVLRPPSSLTIHPKELRPDWKESWSSPRRDAWVHHSVDRTPERRLKAERLIGEASGGSVGLTHWLEAVVVDKTPRASASALNLAAMMVRSDPKSTSEVRQARIVLLEDGSMGRPARGQVFVRAGNKSNDHDFLDTTLAGDPAVADALAALGIEILNPAGELRAALKRRPTGSAWRRIWDLAREVDVEISLVIFKEELPSPLSASTFAQVRSGMWRALGECFLPGGVVPLGESRDSDFVINLAVHSTDLPLLERCGAVAAPRLARGAPEESWLTIFKLKYAERYRSGLQNPKPALDRIVVTGPEAPWPLELMPHLSTPARAAITGTLLQLDCHKSWKVLHSTNNQYPVKTIPSPTATRLAEFGVFDTTIGLAEHAICLHPSSSLPEFFPIATMSDAWAAALRLPLDCREWDTDTWGVFVRDTESRRREAVGTVYSIAAGHGMGCPSRIVAHTSATAVTRCAPALVAVTEDQEVYSSLLLAGIPSLKLDDAAHRATLVEKWGLADGRDMLKEEIVATPDSEPVLLIDRYPPLRLYSDEIADLDLLELQTCSSIDILVSTPKGQESRAAQHHRDGSRLLVMKGSDSDILQRLSDLLRVPINARNILEKMKERASNRLRLAVIAEGTLEGKLVTAVGADALLRKLPRTAIDELQKRKDAPLSPTELARLALAVHGYLILSELKQELSEVGLEPPRAWAGTRDARRFVEGLGFPAEYAGFRGANLAASLEVDGPVTLPALHEYQRQVVDRIQTLLTSDGSDLRGMVTLPTGAGKTRVAVEAVVQLASQGRLSGPVVWIGQRDELCEKAYQ